MLEDVQSDASTGDNQTNSTPEPRPAKPKRVRPQRSLPTARVTFSKQLRCLLSYGLESREGSTPVRMEAVGKAVGLNASTVSLCNPFFVDIGFLSKTGRGKFTPSEHVLEMVGAHEWNPDTAPEKLEPILRTSWAAQALEPRLRLGPVDVEDAIHTLADTVKAGPTYKAELGMILEYLCVSGVTHRDGHQLSWAANSVSAARGGSPQTESSEDQASIAQPAPEVDLPRGSAAQVPPTGGFSFTVSIQVDADEIAHWSPDRIAAFFSGLAQVLAAQNKGER